MNGITAKADNADVTGGLALAEPAPGHIEGLLQKQSRFSPKLF